MPDAAAYQKLHALDVRLHIIRRDLVTGIGGLDTEDPNYLPNLLETLQNHESIVDAAIKEVNCENHKSEAITMLKTAMLSSTLPRLKRDIAGIRQILSKRRTVSVPTFTQDITKYNVDLNNKNPITLLAAFVVLILHMFAGLTYRWSTGALRMINLLLGVTLGKGDSENLSAGERDLLKHFAVDIRTVRHTFSLDAKIDTWAACPSCHSTYAPGQYPKNCTRKAYPSSRKPCGAVVCKRKIADGQSILAPVKPFDVQDFEAFKANLLSRPGIEELLDRGSSYLDSNPDLLDIYDGSSVYDVEGPDGRPFYDGLKQPDLRLLWTFSVDWFNPFTNKAAGKAASVGSIAMTLINLPPSLRNQPGFIFLAALIPGPKEPSLEATNRYLEPVINQLKRSWKEGTRYSSTPAHHKGRSERSAVLVIVSDLPGGRKITGHASHASKKYFCSLCLLEKDNINSIDYTTWPARQRDKEKRHAEAWRDAPTKKARDRLFKEHGIRWSAFWNLEYYDPTKMIIIDPMHNLFLGLVHFHCRYILGISEDQVAKPLQRVATQREVEETKRLLRDPKLTSSYLYRKTRMTPLQSLYQKCALPALKKPKKHDLLQVLVKYFRKDGVGAEKSLSSSNNLMTEGHEILIGDGYFDAEPTLQKEVSQKESTNQPHSHSERSTVTEEPVVEQDLGGEQDHDFKEWVSLYTSSELAALRSDHFTKKEIESFRMQIRSTIRPSSQSSLPPNFGAKGAGKLKAAEWKSGIDFDFVVTAARHFAYPQSSLPPDQAQRREKLFIATMYLALAIRWGTSGRTSHLHASKYAGYMFLYLQTLLELYPKMRLTPNQHGALHIPVLLLRFGPVAGWWMFVFERLIGTLQKVNTNGKLGELEGTMMRTYCMANNLLGFLTRKDCPPILTQVLPLLEGIWNRNSFQDGATTNHRVNKFSLDVADAVKAANVILRKQSKPVLSALSGQSVSRIMLNGLSFTKKKTLNRDGIIFFQPLEPPNARPVPGHIECIFQADDGRHWMAIRRLQSFDRSNYRNPFNRVIVHTNFIADFSELGIELWSTKCSDVIEVIPTTSFIYHSISTKWDSDLEVQVVKCLDPKF